MTTVGRFVVLTRSTEKCEVILDVWTASLDQMLSTFLSACGLVTARVATRFVTVRAV